MTYQPLQCEQLYCAVFSSSVVTLLGFDKFGLLCLIRTIQIKLLSVVALLKNKLTMWHNVTFLQCVWPLHPLKFVFSLSAVLALSITRFLRWHYNAIFADLITSDTWQVFSRRKRWDCNFGITEFAHSSNANAGNALYMYKNKALVFSVQS